MRLTELKIIMLLRYAWHLILSVFKQICHQEEVSNVANVLILIVHELTEYIQKKTIVDSLLSM